MRTLLGLTCAPPERSVAVLTPSPQKVTSFGDRIFTEVTSYNESVGWAPTPNMTGVLVSRRPGEDRCRESSEDEGCRVVHPSQGTPGIRVASAAPIPRAFGGSTALCTPSSRLLGSRAMRQYMRLLSGHPVCGTFYGSPRKHYRHIVSRLMGIRASRSIPKA